MTLSKTLVAVLALTACAWASGPFVIDTPANAAQCVPTLIVWSGGEAPFFLVRFLLPELVRCGFLTRRLGLNRTIEDFANLSGQSFTWGTNVAAGESVSALIVDATGSIAQSAPFSIQPGKQRISCRLEDHRPQASTSSANSTRRTLLYNMLASTLAITVALAASVLAQSTASPFTIDTPFQRGHVDVESFGVNSRTFTWSTNVPAGEQFQILLHDVTGQVAESAMFVIQPGSDDCTLV
ncbi:hypothetical protein VTO73DRAFT_12276 [Trametes versicolor]